MYSNLEGTKSTSRNWGPVWKIGAVVAGVVLIGAVSSLHQDKLGRPDAGVADLKQQEQATAKNQLNAVWVNADSTPSAILTGLGGYNQMKSTIESNGCPNIIFKPTTGNNPYPSILPSVGCEIKSNEVILYGQALHAGVWSLFYLVKVTSSGSLTCCNWHHKPVGGLGKGTCYDPDGCQMSKIFMAVNANLPMTAKPLNFATIRSLIVSGNMCPQQLILKSTNGEKFAMTNPGNCGTRLNRVGITFWTKFSTGVYGQVLLESTTSNAFYVFQVQAFGADGERGEGKTLTNSGSVDVSTYFPTIPSPFVVNMVTSSFEVVY